MPTNLPDPLKRKTQEIEDKFMNGVAADRSAGLIGIEDVRHWWRHWWSIPKDFEVPFEQADTHKRIVVGKS
jgi:hypothetical protein